MPSGRQVVTLSSALASIAVAEERAWLVAEECALDADARYRLGLAVREATAGAVLHGGDGQDSQVRVVIEYDDERIVVTVSDHGPGAVPPRTTGRGLRLIETCVDAVHVVRRTDPPGRDVVLVLHRAGPPATRPLQSTQR